MPGNPYCNAGVVVGDVRLTLTLIGANPLGPRLITSLDSALVLGASSVDEVPRLLSLPILTDRPIAYMLISSAVAGEGPRLRVGETMQPRQRLARHEACPPLPADQVLLITGGDPAFGRDEIVALQDGLTAQAIRAGRAEVIGAPPETAWLHRTSPGQLGRWLGVLRPMLVAAGCVLLEPPGTRLRPRAVPDLIGAPVRDMPVQAVSAGYAVEVPPGLLTRPDARRLQLTWRSIRVEAVVAGSWTILRAGSLVAADECSSIQPCLTRKRARLRDQGVLAPAHSDTLLRVERDVALPSLINAARLATATNRRNLRWRAA